LELRQLESFKTIVEQGSFKKTAKILHYAQSSITTHINGIEDELGGKVFDRIGKKIHITALGKELYQYAVEISDNYNKITRLKDSKSAAVKGKLNIGAAESLILFMLPSIVRNYIDTFPEVDLSLAGNTCPSLIHMIKNGTIDFGLVLAPRITDPELVVTSVKTIPLIFVSGHQCKLKFINKENAHVLKNETLIFTEGNCLLRKHFRKLLSDHDISPVRKLELSGLEPIRQFVAEGLGISLLLELSVKDLIKKNKIKKISHDLILPEYEIQVVYHKNKWCHQAMNEFIDFILKNQLIPLK